MASNTEQLQQLVDQIKHQLERHGLSREDLLALLRQNRRDCGGADIRGIETAAEMVIDQGSVPAEINTLELLGKEINEVLDCKLPLHIFDSRLVLAAKRVRLLWSFLLFGFVCYMVLGGILGGHSTLTGEGDPLLALGLLSMLIVVLGAFEGLQISVTSLRYKDLSTLQQQFPRAFALHKKFRSVTGTNKFLAGRQLVVIVAVFFAAQLTSFSDLNTWPFTDRPFPEWMSPWFQSIFLDLGILGALFVLWTGQLAPQLIATKHAHGFLNLLGMNLVLGLSFLVESTGLTRPGNWVANSIKEGEYIPVSPQERYQLDVDTLHGYGTIGHKKIWEFTNGKAILEYQHSLVFTRPNFSRINNQHFVIKTGSRVLSIDNELLTEQESTSRKVISGNMIEERLPDQWQRLTQELSLNYGSFLPGDVVLTKARVEFPGSVVADQIGVFTPTKYILFRARFGGGPEKVMSSRVEIYKLDEWVGRDDPFLTLPLELRYEKDGTPFIEFAKMHPEVDTHYIFYWQVDYRHHSASPSKPSSAA